MPYHSPRPPLVHRSRKVGDHKGQWIGMAHLRNAHTRLKAHDYCILGSLVKLHEKAETIQAHIALESETMRVQFYYMIKMSTWIPTWHTMLESKVVDIWYGLWTRVKGLHIYMIATFGSYVKWPSNHIVEC